MYEGYNGTIEFDQTHLTIRRSGIQARVAFGKDASPTVIPLPNIFGVRLKPANRMVNGWLQLLHTTPVPAELTLTTAPSNADAVMFTHKQREAFGRLHAWLLTVAATNESAGLVPSATTRQAQEPAGMLRADIAEASGRMRVKLGAGREIKKLQGYLWEGETVRRMTSGLYGKGTGLVVMTDRRLLFVQDGVMSKSTEDFPYSKISSVSWNSGMLLGSLTVFASGNKSEIKNMNKDDGKEMSDLLRERLADSTAPTPINPAPVPAAAAPPVDIADQLLKLAALRDQGILTDDEFNAQKMRLLA